MRRKRRDYRRRYQDEEDLLSYDDLGALEYIEEMEEEFEDYEIEELEE